MSPGSRRHVFGRTWSNHLARQLQYVDETEAQEAPKKAPSTAASTPQTLGAFAFFRRRAQHLCELRQLQYFDAIMPFMGIVIAPFIGSLFGQLLGLASAKLFWLRKVMMLASPSSDGSPAVW